MAFEHQLNNYNELKELRYFITYDKLNPDKSVEQVVVETHSMEFIETEIVWDISSYYVYGNVIIKDPHNIISSLYTHHSLSLRIEATDRFGFTFYHSFSIVNIILESDKLTKSTIIIEFIDLVYNYFNKLYISKGYNNITMTEVLADVLTNGDIGNIDSIIGKKSVFSKTKNTYKNFVIPSNKTFASFLMSRELIDGFSYMHTRKVLYMLNSEDLINMNKVLDMTSSNLKPEERVIFTDLQANNKAKPFLIKNLKRIKMDMFSINTALPNVIEYVFDYDNKNITKNNTKPKSMANFKNNLVDANTSTLLGSASQLGFKTTEVLNNEQNNRFYSFKLMNNSVYEITTDGCFTLDIMQIVGLKLTNKKEKEESYDIFGSGHFYINKIVDKIQGNNFNQIVTLGRSGFDNFYTGAKGK